MNSGIRFNIYFTTPGSQNEQVFTFSTGNNTTVGSIGPLVLQAPFSDGALRYFLDLTIDGKVYDAVPFGFNTISELWDWIQQNWITLGSWYYLPTLSKIALYVNAISGTLAITALTGNQVLIPTLQEDQYFIVGLNGNESPEETLYTIDDLLSWLDANWPFGTWKTDGTYLIYQPNEPGVNNLTLIAASVGAFSQGFSSGFTI